MNKYIELILFESNSLVCQLNLATSEKQFYRLAKKKVQAFTGWYFDDGDTFFACYPAKHGWNIWYLGKEYPLTKELTITLDTQNKDRIFSIKEYEIEIIYKERPPFDNWLDGNAVDLFYHIFTNFENDEFYNLSHYKICEHYQNKEFYKKLNKMEKN